MTVYRRRWQTAQLIWADLMANGYSTSWQIRQRTGLTHMQFWYGLGYLKDELQTQNGQPLVWCPSRGVYALSTIEVEWEDYHGWRFKSLATQLRREEKGMEAGIALHGLNPTSKARLAAVQAARQLVESLVP